MNRLPKEIMVGRWSAGHRQVQIVLKIRDVLGSMAGVNKTLADLGVDFKQSSAYEARGEGYAIYSSFVEIGDPALTTDKIVSELRKSPNVLEARAEEGKEDGIVDSMGFPSRWMDKRVIVVNQKGIANVFHDMQNTFGSGGDVILYKGGVIYGEEQEEYLLKVVGKESMMRNFAYSMELLAALGWGEPTMLPGRPGTLEGTLRLHQCFECEGERSHRPICAFMRGVMVGGAERLFQANFECEETRCTATGDEYCEFELKQKK